MIIIIIQTADKNKYFLFIIIRSIINCIQNVTNDCAHYTVVVSE